MLAPFTVNDTLNATASAQMLCVLDALYFDRQVPIVAMLGPGETLEKFVHRNTTWPPSVAVIARGPHEKWLVIAGTTNIVPQMSLHLDGTLGQWRPDQTCYVNYQWQAAWELIKDEVKDVWPPTGPNAKAHLAGHSYGAALAHVAACELAGQLGNDNVDLLTLGEPRSYTKNKSGPAPSDHWRLTSWRDVVTSIPPYGPLAALLTDHAPSGWEIVTFDWRHYGEIIWLAPGGEFSDVAPIPDPLPEGVSTTYDLEHFSLNYWGRLNAKYQRQGGPPEYAQALTITKAILDGQPVQITAPELPRTLPDPSGSAFPVPVYDGINATSTSGAIPMAYAEPITTGTFFKIILFFNEGPRGWRMVFHVNIAPAQSENSKAREWGYGLMDTIMAGLSNKVECLAMRVQTLASGAPPYTFERGVSQLLTFPFGGGHGGPGKIVSAPADVNQSLQMKSWDISTDVTANWYLRGVAATLYPQNVNGQNKREFPPGLKSYIDKVCNYVDTVKNNQNVGTATPCIPSWDRNPQRNIPAKIKTAGKDSEGNLKITVFGDSTVDTLTPGTDVHVLTGRMKCVTGISGKKRIRKAEVVSGNLELTFLQKICCYTTDIQYTTGQVFVDKKIFVATFNAALQKEGFHKTGGPFDVTPGRLSVRCC